MEEFKVKEKTIHKSYYQSRVHDPAPPNKRTAICGKIVDDVDANGRWKTITCKECLKGKHL